MSCNFRSGDEVGNEVQRTQSVTGRVTEPAIFHICVPNDCWYPGWTHHVGENWIQVPMYENGVQAWGVQWENIKERCTHFININTHTHNSGILGYKMMMGLDVRVCKRKGGIGNTMTKKHFPFTALPLFSPEAFYFFKEGCLQMWTYDSKLLNFCFARHTWNRARSRVTAQSQSTCLAHARSWIHPQGPGRKVMLSICRGACTMTPGLCII